MEAQVNILFTTDRTTRFRLEAEIAEAEKYATDVAASIKAAGHVARNASDYMTGGVEGIAAIAQQVQWADMVWLYTDRGISPAMLDLERRAERHHRTTMRKRLRGC
jgi:hypothetical protein